MTGGEISPRFVGKVDQDLAAARANLAIHVPEIRARLEAGESPEVAFLFFAQTMLRETNAYHLAVMFAASVLTLAERHEHTERMKEFTFRAGFRATVIRHRDCGWFQAVHNDLEPDFVKLLQLAEIHVQECEAR